MSSNFAKLAVGAVLALLLVVVVRNSGEEVESEASKSPAIDSQAVESVRQRLGQSRSDNGRNSEDDMGDKEAVRPAAGSSAPKPASPAGQQGQAPLAGQPPAPAAGAAPAEMRSAATRDTLNDVAALKSAAINDKDVDRRLEAVTLLGVTDDPDVVPILGQALADEDADVRLAAIQALADFTDEGVFDLLGRAAMDDPEADNRYEALEALVDVDEERAAAFAKRALQDKNEEVRDLAESILDID